MRHLGWIRKHKARITKIETAYDNFGRVALTAVHFDRPVDIERGDLICAPTVPSADGLASHRRTFNSGIYD